MTIQNTGDAPLTITGRLDHRRQRGQLHRVVGHNCARLGTRATCVVNVAFKPTSTNTTSVACLTIASDADAATESILLTAKSTGDAAAASAASSRHARADAGRSPSAFGAFTPGVAMTYTAPDHGDGSPRPPATRP